MDTPAPVETPRMTAAPEAPPPVEMRAERKPAQAPPPAAQPESDSPPLDAYDRNYKDEFHKPELVVAVSENFEALSGFRPLEEVRGVLEALRAADAASADPQPGALDLLEARFGAQHVLGGQCVIAATLDADGAVRHLNQTHGLTFGERDGSASERMQRITRELSDAGFDARPSQHVLQDMWDKWVFLASLAGITCLMRGPVGDIAAAPGGTAAALALLEECRAVAERAGHAPGEAILQRARGVLTEPGSSLTASMLRDLQHGHAIEADHVIGDMLARADPQQAAPSLLAVVYAHLKVYEAGRTDTRPA